MMFNKPMILTKSMVSCYDICPKRYEFEYVKKAEKVKTTEIILGLNFHLISSQFYSQIDKTTLAQRNDTKKYFDEIIASLVDALNFGKAYQESSKDLLELLNNFTTFEANRWNREKNFDYFFPVLNEVKLHSEKYRLDGVIDRLFKESNGKHLILEMKTGKYPHYTKSLNGLRRELLIYYLILIDNGYSIDKIGTYFPKINDVLIEDITTTMINRTIREVERIRARIEQGLFPKTESPIACRYCSFTKLCLF